MKIEGLSNVNSSERLAERSIQAQEKLDIKRADQLKPTDVPNENGRSELQDRDVIQHQVDRLNKLTQAFDKKLSFEVHDGTDRVMVKVVDRRTDEVISELPPEEILDMVARINDMVGLLIDQKV